MSQLINLDPKLFSRLSNELIYEICILTGKFILRYDKKLNKIVLVSIIDFADQQWIQFNLTFFKLFNKRKFNIFEDFGRRVTCSISRNGDLVSRMYLQITLPPLQQSPPISDRCKRITDHSELPSNTQKSEQVINVDVTTTKRRRGDKKR